MYFCYTLSVFRQPETFCKTPYSEHNAEAKNILWFNKGIFCYTPNNEKETRILHKFRLKTLYKILTIIHLPYKQVEKHETFQQS